jgi:hypothetical protein
MTENERIAEFNAALDTLLDAMPGATDDEIAASFRDRFPEVCERVRDALFHLALEQLIDKRKPVYRLLREAAAKAAHADALKAETEDLIRRGELPF